MVRSLVARPSWCVLLALNCDWHLPLHRICETALILRKPEYRPKQQVLTIENLFLLHFTFAKISTATNCMNPHFLYMVLFRISVYIANCSYCFRNKSCSLCGCCKETVHFAGPEKVTGVTIDSVKNDSVRLSWNGVAGISNYSVDAQLSRTRRQIGSDPIVEVLTNIFNILVTCERMFASKLSNVLVTYTT